MAAAMVGVAVTVSVQMLLHGDRDPKRVFASLGFGRPDLRVLLTSVVVSAALLASLPLIVAASGGTFVLPENWPSLALSIFLLNGIAEETVYRGYLFHRLHQAYTFRKAAVLGTLLAALAHVPIVATAGLVVGLLAILVATLTFLRFAVLFDRGRNTAWAAAVVHFAADCIIPLGALGLVTPLAIGYWMIAQIVACYLAAWGSRADPERATRRWAGRTRWSGPQ